MTGTKSKPDTFKESRADLTLLTVSNYMEILCSLRLAIKDKADGELMCCPTEILSPKTFPGQKTICNFSTVVKNKFLQGD